MGNSHTRARARMHSLHKYTHLWRLFPRPKCSSPGAFLPSPLAPRPQQTADAQRYATGGVNDVRDLCSLLGAICCVLAAVCHHMNRKTSS